MSINIQFHLPQESRLNDKTENHLLAPSSYKSSTNRAPFALEQQIKIDF